MGSYSIFLLIFCVIPLIQCAATPGEIRSSMSITTDKKQGLENNNNMRADIISFEEFISTYNKKYKNETEERKRHGIFLDNVKTIEEHNILYESGKSSYKMGVNKYSDMTIGEFIISPTGCNSSDVTRGYTRSTKLYDPIDLGDEPDYKNWKEEGAVNPVRDQGDSGTCYAFAATAGIESAIKIKYGKLQQLSEQYLIDCDGKSGGCVGGLPENSIDHVIKNGIAFASGYPYTEGKEGTCNEKTPKTAHKITRKHNIRSGQDDELLNALVHIGPVVVGVYVFDAFKQYKAGIFVDTQCTLNRGINHAMLLVGYGTEKGHKYWLLKNSWDPSRFGIKGYMKLSRNISNYCQISSLAVAPSGAENFLSSTVFLVFTTFACIMINKITVNSA